MTTSLTANTSGSLSYMLMIQDNPDDSLFWYRWTSGSERERIVYPDITFAPERARLFMRFELSLSLAMADKPSQRWLRMFDRLLDRAYTHFGVEPSDVAIQQWLDHDVETIVKMISTHPAGSNLRNFAELAERLIETHDAFPDETRGNNLKKLFINIAKSVRALDSAPASESSEVAPVDIARFAGTGTVLDPALREVWDEHVSTSDMDMTSTILGGKRTIHLAISLNADFEPCRSP